ncbi:MAG TPA: hypothetical protein VKX39_01940 [Bryobacteraceae bacterium]|nr:hypothetical protein [Bryobacteraceae bacterium]
MIRSFAFFLAAPFLCAIANAQTPPAQPAPDPNAQFVDQVLRTATAVQALVKSMNLDKALAAQSVYPPGDPRSLQRTAEFIGVGAGVGLALGEMAHSQKGALIGAAAGSAGGLIVDQVLRHQAARMQKDPADPVR